MIAQKHRVLGLAAALLLFPFLTCACTPTLDWRFVRPPQSDGIELLMPCKPSYQQRMVSINDRLESMTMVSCTAGTTLFALTSVQLAEGASKEPVLSALRDAAATNLNGRARAGGATSIRGAESHQLSEQLLIEGTNAHGKPVHMRANFFVHGDVVYQASVLDQALDEAAVDMFYSNIRWPNDSHATPSETPRTPD